MKMDKDKIVFQSNANHPLSDSQCCIVKKFEHVGEGCQTDTSEKITFP